MDYSSRFEFERKSQVRPALYINQTPCGEIKFPEASSVRSKTLTARSFSGKGSLYGQFGWRMMRDREAELGIDASIHVSINLETCGKITIRVKEKSKLSEG
jgi:hypothetical protein